MYNFSYVVNNINKESFYIPRRALPSISPLPTLVTLVTSFLFFISHTLLLRFRGSYNGKSWL